jgi:hypothetical protein
MSVGFSICCCKDRQWDHTKQLEYNYHIRDGICRRDTGYTVLYSYSVKFKYENVQILKTDIRQNLKLHMIQQNPNRPLRSSEKSYYRMYTVALWDILVLQKILTKLLILIVQYCSDSWGVLIRSICDCRIPGNFKNTTVFKLKF